MDDREVLHKMLLAKGCSIFGRPFSIDQFKDRERCVDWILESIIEPFRRALAPEAPTGPQEPWRTVDGELVTTYFQRRAQETTEGNGRS